MAVGLKAYAQPHSIVDTNTYLIQPLSYADGGTDSGAEGYYYMFNHFVSLEKLPETLPAAQDTNGNWGEAIDGMQLSTRFRHREFLVGEPIMAVVMLRNLSSQPRAIKLTQYTCKVTLFESTNTSTYWKPKPPRNMSAPDSGEYWDSIKTRSEGSFLMNISRYFDMTNFGKYSIQLQLEEPLSDGKGVTNIISGKAAFEIVEKLSASDIAARNEYGRRIRAMEQTIQDHSTNSTPR